MKAKRYLYATACALILSGCAANTMGATPSQNNTLQAVSPSGTAASEGGAMQRGLDSWLKEEWTTPSSSSDSIQGSVPKEELDSRLRGNDEENTSFGLQKYVDKWKAYHENKNKMDEGKPKEASNVENLEKLPAIGK